MGLHLPSWPARLLVRGSWVTGRSGRKLGQARWLQCRSPSQPQGPQHQSGREPALHRPQGPSEWRARGQRHSQREALGGQRGQDIPCGPVCPGGGGAALATRCPLLGPGPSPTFPSRGLSQSPAICAQQPWQSLPPTCPPACLSVWEPLWGARTYILSLWSSDHKLCREEAVGGRRPAPRGRSL